MMKRMILGLFMALTVLPVSAQFEKNTKYVNTSLSGLGLSYSRNERVHFDLRLAGGYFLSDDCAIVTGVDYQHQPHWDQVAVDFGSRYYLHDSGIYLGCGLKYAHTQETDSKFDNFFFVPEVGYAFFLNRYLTLEPAIYYNMSFNDFSDSSKVGLRIGFGFYF